MSVRDGFCDYCHGGGGHLLSTGDERSKFQFGKLWCGVCDEGSKARYVDYSDDHLEGRVEMVSEMLQRHPLQWDEPFDHPMMHLYKVDQSDELWRMRNEVEFRRNR